jgi:hypothetical protein
VKAFKALTAEQEALMAEQKGPEMPSTYEVRMGRIITRFEELSKAFKALTAEQEALMAEQKALLEANYKLKRKAEGTKVALQALLPGAKDEWAEKLHHFLAQTVSGSEFNAGTVSVDSCDWLPQMLREHDFKWVVEFELAGRERVDYSEAVLIMRSIYTWAVAGLPSAQQEPLKTADEKEQQIRTSLIGIANGSVDVHSPDFVCLLTSPTITLAVWREQVKLITVHTGCTKIYNMRRNTVLRAVVVASHGNNIQRMLADTSFCNLEGRTFNLEAANEFVLFQSLEPTVTALLMGTHTRLGKNCKPLTVQALNIRDFLNTLLMMLVPKTLSGRDVHGFLLRL